MTGEIEIRVRWKTGPVMELMKKLQPPRLHQALSVAVNDSARQVERFAERSVAKTLSIPAKRAKQGIWLRPYSTPKTLTATVRGSGSPIPLKSFKAKEKGSGVTAKIWGETRNYPGAFIFGGPLSDHTRPLGMGENVFERVGAKRFPIAKVPGASIADAMTKQAVEAANVAHGQERLLANVMRQLDRYARARR